MQRNKFEFEEKHHIIEVDGIDYEIPQRTAELEKKIREHDEKTATMSEYEGNMAMLGILFGEDKAKQMFPDGEKTNLDKLAKCVRFSLALFMNEYNKMQDEDLQSKLSELKPVLDSVTDLTKAANKFRR